MVSIDLGVFMTIFLCAGMALVGAFFAYLMAIKETRDEIKEAFDRHIAEMHAKHQQAIESERS